MTPDRTFHGLPNSIHRDGWWLDETPAPPDQSKPRHTRPLILLVILVGLADVLFYGSAAGFSLAVFAVAVFAAAQNSAPRPRAVAVLILSVLPAIDYVQLLSIVILSAGMIASIALSRLSRDMPTPLLRASAGLARQMPWRAARDLFSTAHTLRNQSHAASAARRLGRSWAFPLGGMLILLSLLAAANPILDDWLTGLVNLPFDPKVWFWRLAFWAGMALLVWPLLVADPQLPTPDHSPARVSPFSPASFGLNAISVRNALILFNAVLALQTVLDARYLWSGATLPAGMSLATYAHRGAYPLLATALLAGAFALAARPWLSERRALKPLLLLWLAQNILLTLSALYRLDLYVQTYGLTYLRVHAFIWMGLVATGLALTLVQVAAARTNLWLLVRCTALGAATLYLCAFVNFAAIIARVNVAEGKIDMDYLCSLGPTVAAEIPAALKWPPGDSICNFENPQIHGWRDWGFRNWRVLQYLEPQEAADEDPRRG